MMIATEGQSQSKSGIERAQCRDSYICYAYQDSLTCRKASVGIQTKSNLDATDYLEVKRQLDRASRKGFGQKLAEWFSKPDSSDISKPTDKARLRLSLGVRYKVEMGVMPTAALNISHSKYFVSLAVIASFNGSYGLGIYSRMSFMADRMRLDCRVDTRRMTARFWGLGYKAAIENPRTTLDRLACNLKVAYRYRLMRDLWLGMQLSMRNREAQSMNDIGVNYLKKANESLRSLQCGSFSLIFEYDGRRSKNGAQSGLYIRAEQEVVPKFASSEKSTLWHTSFVSDFSQRLWSRALATLSMSGDFWSRQTPWLLWPSVGSSERVRGYREGRYLARNMMSIQAAVRQQLYGPIWLEAWGGAVQIFSEKEEFRWRHTLPLYGLGVRFEFPRQIAVSVGYGFGRRADGFMVNVSERF